MCVSNKHSKNLPFFIQKKKKKTLHPLHLELLNIFRGDRIDLNSISDNPYVVSSTLRTTYPSSTYVVPSTTSATTTTTTTTTTPEPYIPSTTQPPPPPPVQYYTSSRYTSRLRKTVAIHSPGQKCASKSCLFL